MINYKTLTLQHKLPNLLRLITLEYLIGGERWFLNQVLDIQMTLNQVGMVGLEIKKLLVAYMYGRQNLNTEVP